MRGLSGNIGYQQKIKVMSLPQTPSFTLIVNLNFERFLS